MKALNHIGLFSRVKRNRLERHCFEFDSGCSISSCCAPLAPKSIAYIVLHVDAPCMYCTCFNLPMKSPRDGARPSEEDWRSGAVRCSEQGEQTFDRNKVDDASSGSHFVSLEEREGGRERER